MSLQAMKSRALNAEGRCLVLNEKIILLEDEIARLRALLSFDDEEGERVDADTGEADEDPIEAEIALEDGDPEENTEDVPE